MLHPDAAPDVVSDFLESGRLRVSASDLPHVAQVLESRQEDGVWFMTHEKPKGYSYVDIQAAKQRISPHHCCRIIALAADVYTYCKKRNLIPSTSRPPCSSCARTAARTSCPP